jgi:hypothetical protein
MTQYTVGQVVKGKHPPSECPEGFYWRKAMGLEEFKLYPKPERHAAAKSGAGTESTARLTAGRGAAGIRLHIQPEEGFKQVMQEADLSVRALQNLAAWSTAAANSKAEKEKVKSAALAKANSALKEAGLTIGTDGAIHPIPAS